MKVIDVLISAGELLNQNDVVEALIQYKNSDLLPFNPTKEVENKVRKLISHMNLVVEKIASEHVSIKYQQEVSSDNNFAIQLSKLEFVPQEIIKVTDALTLTNVKFRLIFDELIVPNFGRKYLIEYKYRPRSVSNLLDEIKLPFYITNRLISFGIVSDVLFVRNVFDEAKLWNDKFLESINNVTKEIRSKKFA